MKYKPTKADIEWWDNRGNYARSVAEAVEYAMRNGTKALWPWDWGCPDRGVAAVAVVVFRLDGKSRYSEAFWFCDDDVDGAVDNLNAEYWEAQ